MVNKTKLKKFLRSVLDMRYGSSADVTLVAPSARVKALMRKATKGEIKYLKVTRQGADTFNLFVPIEGLYLAGRVMGG